MISNILGTGINPPTCNNWQFEITAHFTAGKLAGADVSRQVSIFDPTIHAGAIGIFDGSKNSGSLLTTDGRTEVGIWNGEFYFDTDTYDILQSYAVGDYLTINSIGIWRPTVLTASSGSQLALKIARVMKAPTATCGTLQIEYNPQYLLNSLTIDVYKRQSVGCATI